jgi:hypothetical protein
MFQEVVDWTFAPKPWAARRPALGLSGNYDKVVYDTYDKLWLDQIRQDKDWSGASGERGKETEVDIVAQGATFLYQVHDADLFAATYGYPSRLYHIMADAWWQTKMYDRIRVYAMSDDGDFWTPAHKHVFHYALIDEIMFFDDAWPLFEPGYDETVFTRARRVEYEVAVEKRFELYTSPVFKNNFIFETEYKEFEEPLKMEIVGMLFDSWDEFSGDHPAVGEVRWQFINVCNVWLINKVMAGGSRFYFRENKDGFMQTARDRLLAYSLDLPSHMAQFYNQVVSYGNLKGLSLEAAFDLQLSLQERGGRMGTERFVRKAQ